MTQHDDEALKLAMEAARADPERAAQLASMLEDRPWRDVARLASYCAQITSLRLKPWEDPPCAVDADDPNERHLQAQKLLREMLAHGVSRFDPGASHRGGEGDCGMIESQ